MPNHVKNRIEIIGTPEQVQEVFDRFNTHAPAELYAAHDGSLICFNEEGAVGWLDTKTGRFAFPDKTTQLGLPDGYSIKITQPTEHFPDFKKVIPPPKNIFEGDLGDAEMKMCEREGRPNWRDWNIANWDTKWNSYSNAKETWNVFTFETAWNGVRGIMNEIAKRSPLVGIIYEYADEDTGHNVGRIEFNGGKEVFSHFPEGGSAQAYELAFRLRPEIAMNYKFVDGKYQYEDED